MEKTLGKWWLFMVVFSDFMGLTIFWLVVEPNPSEKYVNWDDYSELNGKIEFMFQTTNQ